MCIPPTFPCMPVPFSFLLIFFSFLSVFAAVLPLLWIVFFPAIYKDIRKFLSSSMTALQIPESGFALLVGIKLAKCFFMLEKVLNVATILCHICCFRRWKV